MAPDNAPHVLVRGSVDEMELQGFDGYEKEIGGDRQVVAAAHAQAPLGIPINAR